MIERSTTNTSGLAPHEYPPVTKAAIARFALGGVVVCVVALTVLGLAGRTGWQLDLMIHFRFQYAWILLLTTLGLAALRWLDQ